jgi:hypothetical protein
VIDLEVKPKENKSTLPSNEKEVALMKGKGKGRKVAA